MSHTDLMRARWSWIGAVLLVAAVAGGAVLLWKQNTARKAAAVKPAPPPRPERLTLSGKLQAQHVLPVPAPMEGILDQFLVEVGQEVVEGQLLARVKSGALEGARDGVLLDVQKSQEKVNSLDAQLTAARLEASRAGAVAVSARALAERTAREYQRQTRLHAEGATPRLVYERAERENARAQADWQAAQSVADQANQRVDALVKDVADEQKLLDQKSQTLETNKEQMAAGDVLSPVNGIVVARHAEPGANVNPSLGNLLEIGVDTSLLEVHVEAAPDMAKLVGPGAAAIVQVVELGSEPIPATVKDVQGTKIIVTLASPNALLKPGLTAQVTIPLR